MNLASIADHSRTDKNTTHSYLPLYEELLNPRRLTARHVLEIGIGPAVTNNGGSIKMWCDYFQAAHIYALDIIPRESVWPGILNSDRITVFTSSDAYDAAFVHEQFASKGIRFDLVLDDGPHTLESMVRCLQLYLPLLAPDGILIIEDVQKMEWIEHLKAHVPPAYREHVMVFDLRSIKQRYDDIVFVVDTNPAKQTRICISVKK